MKQLKDLVQEHEETQGCGSQAWENSKNWSETARTLKDLVQEDEKIREYGSRAQEKSKNQGSVQEYEKFHGSGSRMQTKTRIWFKSARTHKDLTQE